MKKICASLLIFTCLICIHACKNKHNPTKRNNISNRFLYAQNIISHKGSDTVIVYISNKQMLDSITYILKDSAHMQKSDFDKKIFYVQIPISRVGALSTTDIALINELGKTESIIATCDYYRTSNEILWKKHAAGNLADLGSSMNENREKILAIHPNVIIKTIFSINELSKDKVLIDAGIPVIYMNNWQEISPLGRAEWLRFIGLLYDCEKHADSVFNSIEKNYSNLQTKVSKITNKPNVIAGDMIKDSWFMPGGKSYISLFIKDAGGKYVYEKNSSTGSTPLNIEQILEISKKADVWIGSDAESFNELFSKNSHYKLLEVCNKKQCYNYNKRKNKFGGNDFWESGTVRPDLILADLIKILHPSILPTHEFIYFKKIE